MKKIRISLTTKKECDDLARELVKTLGEDITKSGFFEAMILYGITNLWNVLNSYHQGKVNKGCLSYFVNWKIEGEKAVKEILENLKLKGGMNEK